MGSIHGKIISSSCSWNDNAPSSSSLCAAHDKIEIDCDIYCDVCDSISQVRDGLGSHMRAMHVKKHNPFCRKEGFLGCSEEKSQRHLYKSRPALKLHENDRLTCDECNYKFKLQSSLRRHERFGHKGEN